MDKAQSQQTEELFPLNFFKENDYLSELIVGLEEKEEITQQPISVALCECGCG